MKAFPFTKPVPLWACAAHWEEGHWLNISKQCICLSLSHLVTMPFFRAARSNFLYTHNLACLVLDTTLLSVPFRYFVSVLAVQYLAEKTISERCKSIAEGHGGLPAGRSLPAVCTQSAPSASPVPDINSSKGRRRPHAMPTTQFRWHSRSSLGIKPYIQVATELNKSLRRRTYSVQRGLEGLGCGFVGTDRNANVGACQWQLVAVALGKALAEAFARDSHKRRALVGKATPRALRWLSLIVLERQRPFGRRRAEEGEHHCFLASIAPLILEKREKLSIHISSCSMQLCLLCLKYTPFTSCLSR